MQAQAAGAEKCRSGRLLRDCCTKQLPPSGQPSLPWLTCSSEQEACCFWRARGRCVRGKFQRGCSLAVRCCLAVGRRPPGGERRRRRQQRQEASSVAALSRSYATFSSSRGIVKGKTSEVGRDFFAAALLLRADARHGAAAAGNKSSPGGHRNTTAPPLTAASALRPLARLCTAAP